MSDEPTPSPREQRAARAATVQPGMPWSPEAEKGLLSCLMQDPERLLPQVIQQVPTEVFYNVAHETIYRRLLAMFEARQPMDLATVTNAFRDAQELDKIGGPGFVSDLWMYVPVTSHLSYYQKILLQKWYLRRLMATAQGIMDEAREYGKDEADDDLAQFMGKCEQRVFELYQEQTEKSSRRGMAHVSAIMPEVIQQIETALENRGHTTRGIATGLTSLDRITMGVEAGMFVVAARPSKGKTAFVMQVALNIGLGQGDYPEFRQEALPVGVFSLETNDANLVRRGLLNLAELNMRRLTDGLMSIEEKENLIVSARRLMQSKIYIEACYGLTIQELRAKARNAVRKFGLKVLIIDYLQLMQTTSAVRKTGNRQAELAEISIGVKMLAHELDIPIFVLAQLNREGDTPRPKMSQIRDCGQIEQDADYCALLCEAPEWAGADDPPEAPWTYVGLDIAKQKDGATTTHTDPIVLRFDKEFFRISSRETKLFSNDAEQRQPRQVPKYDASREKRPRGRPRKDGSQGGRASELDQMFSNDDD